MNLHDGIPVWMIQLLLHTGTLHHILLVLCNLRTEKGDNYTTRHGSSKIKHLSKYKYI